MFDRFALRATFWGTFAILATAWVAVSLGGSLSWVIEFLHGLLRHVGLQPSPGTLATFGLAAPGLSLLALAVAVGGWQLLHRDLSAQRDQQGLAKARAVRLQTMMHASDDGVFLLRPVRNERDEVVDFEVDEVNEMGARLIRATRDGLVGRRLLGDTLTATPALPFELYVGTLQSGTPHRADLRVSRRKFEAGWLSHQVVAVGDALVVTLRDVTVQKRSERALRRASVTDELTGLYNRRGFMALADRHVAAARREVQDFALLYVDMDDFKLLNDTHGHREGDRALMAVGRLLRRAVRDCDLVARMGGDEFTILAVSADTAAARLIQRRIEQRVALLNASGELAAPLSLTIGHTRVRAADHAPLVELLGRADALLYSRKRRRKAAALAALHAEARGDIQSSRMATAAPVERRSPRRTSTSRRTNTLEHAITDRVA